MKDQIGEQIGVSPFFVPYSESFINSTLTFYGLEGEVPVIPGFLTRFTFYWVVSCQLMVILSTINYTVSFRTMVIILTIIRIFLLASAA